MAEKGRRDSNDMELGDLNGKKFEGVPKEPIRYTPAPSAPLASHPVVPIIAYCLSSILMTVMNKYVVSGTNWNMNFLLLAVQSTVCTLAVVLAKRAGIIDFRDFRIDDARKWFPISLMLVGMIWTGTKAIRFLSVPVYTIFKNLGIIIIAYGEVLWFGGSVSPMVLFSFGLMVLSSVVAAWGDIRHALDSHGHASSEAATAVATLNTGFLWMMVNCFCSSAYVLVMRIRIKATNFKDYDTMFYNNLLTIPVLVVCSLVVEDWSRENLLLNFPLATRNTMIVSMIVSGFFTMFISYSSAWCIRITSAATYSMVGALNKLPIALSGYVFFDTPVTFTGISALGLGFGSGLVYAAGKQRQMEKQKAQPSMLPTSNAPISASAASQRDGLKA